MTAKGGAVVVRAATAADAAHVARFIRELARYEQLEHQLDLDEARLRDHLGGAQPACGALLAEIAGTPIGFALFFPTYSTFRTEICLHLEDLFVLPERRGQGVGKALLKRVAAIAAERGCGRLEWAVLDWNEPAIRFYQRLGARPMHEWTVFRVAGPELAALAARFG